MRTEEEIKKAIDTIYYNDELTYSYREDIADVLEWVLGDIDSFLGLKKED